MNVFTTSLLYHFAALQRLLPKYGVQASVDIADGVLWVRGRNRFYRFYPQWLAYENDRMRFTLDLQDQARAFIGWRPYFNKRWPIAIDKVVFKTFCAEQGLRTPAMWRRPSADLRDFIVKRTALSFGKGIRGPFRVHDAKDAAQVASEDGYYEAFVEGQIVKASFWNEGLAALEVKRQPRITGDGKHSLRELLGLILRPGTPKDEWQTYADVAAYQGLDLDAVPPAGRNVLVDFRFATYVEPVSFENPNELRKSQDSPLIRQLRELGPRFYQSIPEEFRECTLYSVDAIFDAEERLWLLEMNCNPACHPDCYEPMLTSLFGAPEATAPAPVPAPQALPPYNPLPFQARPPVATEVPADISAPPALIPPPPARRWLS